MIDVPPEIVVRPERVADRRAIAVVVASAFGSDDVPRLVERIRSSPQYIPELALVAESAGSIVGYVMISGATIRMTAAAQPIVMLSPLAVDPGHQRRGIGATLVRAVTGRAAELGWPFVVLEGDPGYYARFGFGPAAAWGISMPLPDWASPEAAQVLVLSADRTPPKGHVVYPAAFDALE